MKVFVYRKRDNRREAVFTDVTNVEYHVPTGMIYIAVSGVVSARYPRKDYKVSAFQN